VKEPRGGKKVSFFCLFIITFLSSREVIIDERTEDGKIDGSNYGPRRAKMSELASIQMG
jgi:hypothetical protein